MKKIRRVKVKQKRHIEDAPFYKFEYNFDDLPLDPARPFINEQIGWFCVLSFFRSINILQINYNIKPNFQQKSVSQNRKNFQMILHFTRHQKEMVNLVQ